MVTCEQCIHFKSCYDLDVTFFLFGNAEQCTYFKDASKFVELPCKVGVVGNIVYFIKNGKVNKCYVTTIRIHNEKSVIFTLMIEELYAFYDVSAKDIYKNCIPNKRRSRKSVKRERGTNMSKLREKIFRGKPKDKGMYYFFSQNWKDSCKDGFVYGSLVASKQTGYEDRYYICVTALCSVTHCVNNGITSMIEVIPETIGEYTNLTDKNGVKIFEGDIVLTQPYEDRPYSKSKKSKRFIGVVKYKIQTFKGNRFYPTQKYSASWGADIKEDLGRYCYWNWGDLWGCEVIGNIHDNPEREELKKED